MRYDRTRQGFSFDREFVSFDKYILKYSGFSIAKEESLIGKVLGIYTGGVSFG